MKHHILALFVAIAVVAAFAAFSTVQPTHEVSLSPSDDYLNGQVVAIRHLSLKEGADAAEADRFIATEWNPAWRNYMPGAREFILKGERGKNIGQYIHLVVFDSRRSRDFYWPAEATPTPATEAAWMAADTTMLNTVNAKLNEYFEPGWGAEFTDYIELTR